MCWRGQRGRWRRAMIRIMRGCAERGTRKIRACRWCPEALRGYHHFGPHWIRPVLGGAARSASTSAEVLAISRRVERKHGGGPGTARGERRYSCQPRHRQPERVPDSVSQYGKGGHESHSDCAGFFALVVSNGSFTAQSLSTSVLSAR